MCERLFLGDLGKCSERLWGGERSGQVWLENNVKVKQSEAAGCRAENGITKQIPTVLLQAWPVLMTMHDLRSRLLVWDGGGAALFSRVCLVRLAKPAACSGSPQLT